MKRLLLICAVLAVTTASQALTQTAPVTKTSGSAGSQPDHTRHLHRGEEYFGPAGVYSLDLEAR